MMSAQHSIDIVKKRFPALDMDVPAAGLIPETARNGMPTARLETGGYYLHSRYNPMEEAQKALDEALNKGSDLLVLAGMGLGYIAELAIAEGVPVLLSEPDPALFKACIAARDLERLLSEPNFILCTVDELKTILENTEARSVAYIENPAIARTFPEEVARIRAVWESSREKDRINTATLKRFGRRWVRNLEKNLEAVCKSSPITELSGVFSGMPAMVLAAGPSLDTVLPYIDEVKRRCLLIAVDTSMRSLGSVGAAPDFLVVVDPQFINSKHLDGCDTSGTILVSEPAVWPGVFRKSYRAVFTGASIFPLGNYLDRLCQVERGKLAAGGSVATTAWDLARFSGAAPVFMAGLDLGFPGARTHARASLFEQAILDRARRLRPASHDLFLAYRNGHSQDALANDGSSVVTDKRLALYSWWFSAKMARYPETGTRNLSEKGLAIPGMPLAGIDDVLALPEIREELDRRKARLLNEARASTDLNRMALSIQLMIHELENIAELAEEAVGLARSEDQNMEYRLARLDEIDSLIMASTARDVVGFLFASLEEVLEGKSASIENVMEKTARIYASVVESARWHAGLFKPILKPDF